MAFSEIELMRIEKEVGGFCKRRSPIEIRDKLSFEYRIKTHDVIIYTRRPRWDNPQEWIESDMAKIKYVRTSNRNIGTLLTFKLILDILLKNG